MKPHQKKQTLFVYLSNHKVGQIDLSNKQFIFQYAHEWLIQPNAIPLSLTLPLQSEAFESKKSQAFFRNLLPEGNVRQAVARSLKISEQNDFALLEALGGECAGAIFVLPQDAPPIEKQSYKALSAKELHNKINQLPTRPFLVGEEGIRLSLAGAQNKLPVYVKNNQIHLPLYTSPSSHILKIPIPDLDNTVMNEAFCMTLAKRMGLPVPSVILHQGIETLYLVERYDRAYNPTGQLMRLHQEDFCQALGISPDFKYEAEGGPSLQNCFDLIRQYSSQPASDVKALLDWVIFNYFIGNADGHAKNLALLMTTNEGLRLAPFYDLICTRVYPELTSRLAMKIGSENRPDWVMVRHFKKFAHQVDIQSKWVINTLHQFAQALPDKANQLANEYQATYGTTPILAKIVKVIENQVRQTLLALNQT